MPACDTKFDINFDITSAISIRTRASSKTSLISSLNDVMGSGYWRTELLPNTPYITIKVQGFSDGSINSTASSEFFSLLKQTLALALIFDLISANKYLIGFEKTQELMQAKQTITPHWVMKATILNEADSKHMEVPPELAAFINTVNLNSKNITFQAKDPNARTLLGSGVIREPESSEEFNQALTDSFSKISAYLSLIESSDKKRISAALEWFLEAKMTANQSVSLIYFCIGLEAILGDESNSRELQLKEKLADRVAYMLGNTSAQRASLKEDFKAIYAARSDLVHAKERRISKKQTELLNKAEFMLSYLISREIRGLMK